jgi:hypothetical protein
MQARAAALPFRNSGLITAESDRVIQAHFAANTANLCRFADKQFNFTFQHNLANNLRTRADDNFWLAFVLVPVPATWFLDKQVPCNNAGVAERDVTIYRRHVAADSGADEFHFTINVADPISNRRALIKSDLAVDDFDLAIDRHVGSKTDRTVNAVDVVYK